MSRKRNISTEISKDSRLNKLSHFAALLYTWSIPHCNDDCYFSARDPDEFKMTVFPGRGSVKEVETALKELLDAALMGQAENGHYYLPSESFYKYQTYINTEKRQETPKITSSLSPSPTLSPIRVTPSADSLKKETRKPDALKEDPDSIANRIYKSDPVKFARLFQWINKKRKAFIADSVIEETLTRAESNIQSGAVDWWPYLDRIVDKENGKANARAAESESQKFKSDERDFLQVVKNIAKEKNFS